MNPKTRDGALILGLTGGAVLAVFGGLVAYSASCGGTVPPAPVVTVTATPPVLPPLPPTDTPAPTAAPTQAPTPQPAVEPTAAPVVSPVPATPSATPPPALPHLGSGGLIGR